MIDESIWTALEQAPPSPTGWAKTRVYPQSRHDIWAAVKHPQMYRTLINIVDATDAPLFIQLPQLQHMVVEIMSHGDDRVELHTRLEDSNLTDVFTVLADDIASRISDTTSATDGVSAMIARLHHWRNLLQPESGSGLGLEQRRGLFGEIFILRRLLIAGITPIDVVKGWVGPTKAHQDFQMSTVAIEVKATATKQPQSIRISSERQLDREGLDALVVAHVSLDERNTGAGESLPGLVFDVESRLRGAVLSTFRQILYTGGLLPSVMTQYEELVYTVRSFEYFEVQEGFPCILENMCPPGLGDVQYSVQLGALQEYLVDESNLTARIGKSA